MDFPWNWWSNNVWIYQTYKKNEVMMVIYDCFLNDRIFIKASAGIKWVFVWYMHIYLSSTVMIQSGVLHPSKKDDFVSKKRSNFADEYLCSEIETLKERWYASEIMKAIYFNPSIINVNYWPTYLQSSFKVFLFCVLLLDFF